ncbi:hypothetical protein GN156_06755 [bacterium LRH843]|nr:hypothetical protein [bacterium LRH843]
MNNVLEWTLKDKKKTWVIHPIKLSLFQQCTLVECEEESIGTRYMLFFYKNTFITAQPLVEYIPTSFLAKVETSGIHLHAQSPLLSLLPTSSLDIIPFNQLLSQLKRSYTAEETALIFSYFDSYIPHDKLEKILKDLFYSYRRNGQLIAAYRLAAILLSRGYAHDWVQSITKQLDYSAIAKRYQIALQDLLSSEPIYVEQKCFLTYQKPESYKLLQSIYAEQQNVCNTLILMLHKWIVAPTKLGYKELTHTLSVHFEQEDVLSCLTSLLSVAPITSGLHQDVYHRLIEKRDYQQAIQFLFTHPFSLSPEEQNQLPSILEQLEINELSLPIKDMSKHLFDLLKGQPLILDQLIRKALPSLLENDNIQDIQTWLKESHVSNHLPIMKKLNTMVDLLDEPDMQLKLGQCYYELEQYEKAIECFSWEMELHPNDYEPVQWITKSYQKMGNIHEAKTYQQLLIQLQRSS